MDDIKARINIVDLIGETVALRRAGRTFKALCPFHPEKTPSFVVDPDRQTWHCFGACSAGGDIFAWTMRRQGMTFPEALQILAERAGVALRRPDPQANARAERLQRLRSANEGAAAFFREHLRRSPDAEIARAYVAARGLTEEILERFGVGYAPEALDALHGHLGARGFSTEELVAAGLLVETERGAVDRFRGRLMFPIRDERGRCAGFGGRTLTGDQAKYVNTPQTDLFDKSGLLYALDLARDAAREADQIVIVEGYMDVIAAHQHGQPNVVASMGTALTERQVALVKPITRHIVLALDADTAGAMATDRGIETTRAAIGTEAVPVPDARGLIRMQDHLAADIRILTLPPGLDPDDLIRRDPGRWTTLLAQALGYLDYRFQRAAARRNLEDPRERAALVQELAPLVAAVAEPVVHAAYVQRLAGLARVDATVITRLPRRGRDSALPSPRAGDPEAPAAAPRDQFAVALLRRLIARPETAALVPPETSAWTEDPVARLLLAAVQEGGTPDEWEARVEGSVREAWDTLRQEARHAPPLSEDQAARAVTDTVASMRKRHVDTLNRLRSEAVAAAQRQYGHQAVMDASLALHRAPTTPPDEAAPEDEVTGAARSILEIEAAAREIHGRPRKERDASA